MAGDLHGRVALVTGGDSGIGAACALALAEAGADIGVLYHSDEEGARGTARGVEARGRKAVIVQMDVGDEAAVERAFGEAAVLGTPDILVNAAGLNMSDVRVADMDADQWGSVLRTDLTGAFLCSRRFVRGLAGKRPAAIVNITSIHEWAVRAGGADYIAAKAGQGALARTLALELADQGVTVNSIAPGMILTPMNQEAIDDPERRREQESHIPMRRAGRPEEVARAAVFLASPASAYTTGATITVDGGLSLVVAPGA